MRTRLKTTAVVCCVYVFGMIAGAGSFKAAAQQPSVQDADTSSVMCFTLDEAMGYALEHNWDLQNSSLAVRQAEADRWGAIATMLPQVNGTLDYSNYMGYEMEFGETGLAIAMPPYGSIGVNAAMSVSGAQIISALIGKLSIEMADVSHRQSQQEVAEQVRLLYFSALVSTQTMELLRRNLGTVRKLHEFSQKSVDAGVAEQVDADQILVQVATLESSINEAERGLEMIYNSMRLQMNVGFDKEIVLTQTLDELMDVEHSLDLLYDDFILENNFSYQLALQSTELYKKQKNLAGWAYGPTLSAFYQYTGRKYFSDEMTMNMTPPNMVGLTLSIPIFSSGRKHASSLDVTNAATTLITAQSTYVQAALDYVTAQIELEKLLNKNTYGQSTQEQK